MSNCFSTFLRIRPNWRLPLIFRNSLICTRNYNLSICAGMLHSTDFPFSGKKVPRRTKNPLSEERGFFVFLYELITLESGIIPTLVVKDGSTIALNLDERERWLIKVLLKLHGRKHHHNLYLTE